MDLKQKMNLNRPPHLKSSKARTNLVLGPPGTGKTTSLLGLVEEALKAGIPPDRIAYLAFTRKAANEAVDRAVKRFNLQREDFPFFRTLHSLAFRSMGLSRSEVMTTQDYVNMADDLKSYTFTHQYDETAERPPMGGGLGDRCLRLYALAKATGLPVEEIRQAYDNAEVEPLGLEKFCLALDRYKADTLKYDFSDFLDHELSLDVDLFILDEAQDLTAQQWAFARRLAKKCPKVFIAGDDDQAIFQWSGADIRTFLGFEGDRYVLPISYRLPRKVFDVADRIAGRIAYRAAKVWEPKAEEGDVGLLSGMGDLDLTQDDWMFLVRRNSQVYKLIDLCRNAGVVYNDRGHWSNDDATVRAVLAYERMRRGERVSPTDAHRVCLYAGAEPRQETTSYQWQDVRWPFEGSPDWLHGMPGLPDSQREYIRLLRRNGESLVNPGRVTLSTIHGAKGGECQNVVLFPKLNRRVQRGMNLDPDQEHRVWYVAASRSLQNLFVVREPSKYFYDIT